MFDQLYALGNVLQEDDLVQVLTNGLGAEFHPFIRSLENRLDSVGFDDLYGLLLNEEANLLAKTHSTKEPVAPTTHMAQGNNYRNYNQYHLYTYINQT